MPAKQPRNTQKRRQPNWGSLDDQFIDTGIRLQGEEDLLPQIKKLEAKAERWFANAQARFKKIDDLKPPSPAHLRKFAYVTARVDRDYRWKAEQGVAMRELGAVSEGLPLSASELEVDVARSEREEFYKKLYKKAGANMKGLADTLAFIREIEPTHDTLKGLGDEWQSRSQALFNLVQRKILSNTGYFRKYMAERYPPPKLSPA